jgi:hypothetical protein
MRNLIRILRMCDVFLMLVQVFNHKLMIRIKKLEGVFTIPLISRMRFFGVLLRKIPNPLNQE